MDETKMVKSISKRIRNKKRLWIFRAKLMKLYEQFEVKMEALCQQHGVEINLWYSPSKIPQPKFMFGRVGLSADTLYDEEEFSLLFSPKVRENIRKNSKSKKNERAQLKKSQIIKK